MRVLALALVGLALFQVASLPPPAGLSSQQRGDGAARGRRENVVGHHHESHHGGVVGMSGEIHLEAVARDSGEVRVYVSDFNRRPLPHAETSGTAIVHLASGQRTLDLAVVETESGEALGATGPAIGTADVQVEFELDRDDGPVFMDFILPVLSGELRVAGARRSCSPPTGADAGEAPVCVLDYPGAVTALAARPGTDVVYIGVVGRAVSGWRVPATDVVAELEVPPGKPWAELGGAPQVEAPRRIAIDPDGREAVLAFGDRLVRYALSSGVPFNAMPTGAFPRDLDWSDDGKRVVVVTQNDTGAHVINPSKSKIVGTVALGGQPTAAALVGEARRLVVATDGGTLLVADAADGAVARPLAAGGPTIRVLESVGESVLSAGDDGVIRLWDLDRGSEVARATLNAAVFRLAVTADRELVAAAGTGGTIHLYRLPGLEKAGSIVWHRRSVTGLAWAGQVLVSGDVEGQVAVWDYSGEGRLRAAAE